MRGVPGDLAIARTHGNGSALRFLYFRPSGFRTAPVSCAAAAPRAELSPTPRSARGRLLPSRGHREKDALRAGITSSAPAPPVALPRGRGVLPTALEVVTGAGG